MDNVRLNNATSGATLYQIAFSQIKGINLSTGRQLLNRIGNPENFFSLSPSVLAATSGLDTRHTATEYRKNLLEHSADELRYITQKNITARFFTEENYPKRLLECEDGPTMLYSIGNCNLDSLHAIAVVGTRHATPYGIEFTKELISDLAAKLDSLVIISGLAYGIDIAAHRAALDNNVPTVAVVAHGLNTIYPADHRQTAAKIVKENGGIITEYRSDADIHKGNFLARNRIVAGLADAVVIVESDIRGGAMTTARIASAYNREVMAVPGRTIDTYSRGCNELIAQCTAQVVRSADDIISAMNWTARAVENTQQSMQFEITPEQRHIMEYITQHPGHTHNEISVNLGIPIQHLTATLFNMELADLIITLPGGRYDVKATK